MTVENSFNTIENLLPDYLDFLCDVCGYEARAIDSKTIDSLITYIAAFASEQGFSVTRTSMEKCGDFLSVDCNEKGEKGCLFMAHTDTVHEKGAFGSQPVTRLSDRIIAPGAIDCKGGIAIALLTMKALKENGYSKHLRLLLTSDEEITNTLGGRAELDYFKQNAEGFPYAINCETSENNEVVISRKGIQMYRIDIKGIGGHSGIHYFDCKNAIEEAANKIIALQSESQPDGITYSCNIIQGGGIPNIVPDSCSITVDVRIPRYSDVEKAENTIKRITETCYVKNTVSTFTTISKRPPMEKSPNTDALFDKLINVCKKYNLGSLTPVESGGGSDSCYTQALGITSICGMGACGEFCHTNQEYALIDSIPLRAKILAAFLMEENV